MILFALKAWELLCTRIPAWVAVIFVTLAGGLWIRLAVTKGQLAKSKAQVVDLQQTITGYKLAGQKTKNDLELAKGRAELIGERTKKLLEDLTKAPLPQTDAEAREWAVKAAQEANK